MAARGLDWAYVGQSAGRPHRIERRIPPAASLASVGRRITVQDRGISHERLGRSADEIAAEYDLTLADVYAALAYYFHHREEIDAHMTEDRAFAEVLRATHVVVAGPEAPLAAWRGLSFFTDERMSQCSRAKAACAWDSRLKCWVKPGQLGASDTALLAFAKPHGRVPDHPPMPIIYVQHAAGVAHAGIPFAPPRCGHRAAERGGATLIAEVTAEEMENHVGFWTLKWHGIP